MTTTTPSSLFDLLPEEEAKAFKSDEPTESKKKTKTTAPTTSKEEPEPEVYDIDRVVYYAGHRIDVPGRDMKLEDVRAWLETQFPELTKERCELVYDKTTGHIVPVLKAHKKGATRGFLVYTEVPQPEPPVYHLLDEEGAVWEVRTTQTGRFQAPVKGQYRIGFPGCNLAVPRIPVRCLAEIVTRFQADPDVEHLAYILFDRRHNAYEVMWPKQRSNSVSVIGEGFMENEDVFAVAQIHSHGRMPAFFSSTDNEDEIRTGLYGVIGDCQNKRPTLRWRMSCGGNFCILPAQDYFDGDIEPWVVTSSLQREGIILC